MTTNRRIQTTELDFDGIKSSLKNYLQGQSQFSDYDFEGSGLSILLDVLAYNTHYNALYTNLAINEAFIDSAAKRSSVISKARELGYTPKSATAATAVVSVLMINDTVSAPSIMAIPAYTMFPTQVDGNTYTFYNTSSQVAYKNGNQYIFSNVELKEGTPLQNTYTYSAGTPIIIPNVGVDKSTIRVTVQESSTSTTIETFSEASAIVDIDSTSAVYFLQELEDQTYQVEFGDGVIGKALSPGNYIIISYMVCSEDAPNGASSFTYGATLSTGTSAFVTTTTAAMGGAAPEGIESIRWNAPRTYTAQNRCITAEDYKTTITAMFPEARSVAVWGGEENNPPEYGKVFISVTPRTTDFLTVDQNTYILDTIIKPRKSLTVNPVMVKPTYLDVELNVSFYYNPKLTSRTALDLSTLVSQTVQNFNDSELNKFGGIFKHSALTRSVDNTEESIQSSIVTLKVHRAVDIVYNQTAKYIIDLGNPIYNSGVPEQSVLSTGINIINVPNVCYIEDIPVEGSTTGTLKLFYLTKGVKHYVRTVGSINYQNGVINVDDIIITGSETGVFKFIIKTQSNDIAPARNQIVRIPSTMVTVTPIVDKTADNYTFTSSRN